jgi:hypothetical protein
MFITEVFEKISEIFGVSLSLIVWTHQLIFGASVRLSFCLSACINAVPCRTYFLEISHCGLPWKTVEKISYLVKFGKMVFRLLYIRPFGLSVCPQISAWLSLNEFTWKLVSGLLWKHVQEFQICLEVGKNIGTLSWRPRYIAFFDVKSP